MCEGILHCFSKAIAEIQEILIFPALNDTYIFAASHDQVEESNTQGQKAVNTSAVSKPALG